MSEVEIVSFQPTAEPLFSVIYTPNSGMLRKDRELQVVGSVLTKITTLDSFTPVTHFKLEPAFIYKNDIVLGASYWDSAKDGGQLTITPVRKRRKKAASTK